MASINNSSSPYVNTPIVNEYITYLDIWNGFVIPQSANDKLIKIAPKYHERPDLLAYDLYGTVGLWWVFSIRNKDFLIDPISDFKAGLSIYISSRATLEALF